MPQQVSAISGEVKQGWSYTSNSDSSWATVRTQIEVDRLCLPARPRQTGGFRRGLSTAPFHSNRSTPQSRSGNRPVEAPLRMLAIFTANGSSLGWRQFPHAFDHFGDREISACDLSPLGPREDPYLIQVRFTQLPLRTIRSQEGVPSTGTGVARREARAAFALSLWFSRSGA